MTSSEKCHFCNALIEGEACEFATYKKTVDGKEYSFCCRSCAQKLEEQSRSV